MSFLVATLRTVLREKIAITSVSRALYSSQGKPSTPKAKSPPAQAAKPKQASAAATDIDNTSYKVPEYYNHDEFSFYDIDTQMKSHRLPQPSSVHS